MAQRRSTSRALGVTILAASAALSGCADPDPIIEHRYAPYEGGAYPDRREKIVVPEGGMAVVTDSLSDTLSLLSIATGELIGEYPVGRDPVTIDGPHHVAVDAAGGAAYVALSYPVEGGSGPHASHGGSTTPGYAQKLSLDDLRVLGQVRVEPNPGDIVLSEDGKRLVVSHFDRQRAQKNPMDLEAARSSLAVIDPASIALVGSPEPVSIPVCVAAHGVALSRPDAARAYVACYGEDSLAVVDLTDPSAEPKRIPVGAGASPNFLSPSYGPYAAVMSPDQKTVAVSNIENKDVRFFDVETETFDDARTITLQGIPMFTAWTPDGARLYVPTQGPDQLFLYDVSQGASRLVASRPTLDGCQSPHVVDFAEGSPLFLVCEGDHVTTPGSVLRFDPETLDPIGETPVGMYPDGIVRVAGGAK